MEDVERHLGFRVSLDNLAHTSLGAQKSAQGMQAIQWWREGNIDAIKKYCLDDVRLTRDLYEYGRKNGLVRFEPKEARFQAHPEVPVTWRESPQAVLAAQGRLF